MTTQHPVPDINPLLSLLQAEGTVLSMQAHTSISIAWRKVELLQADNNRLMQEVTALKIKLQEACCGYSE